MSRNVVGIVCALAAEARHLGPATAPDRTNSTRDVLPVALADGTLLAVTGMGATAAAAGARALLDAGACALASWGMAGGLDPALVPGTICLPSEVMAPDGVVLPTTERWRSRLDRVVRALRPVAGGRLLTSARAIGSPQEKAALFRQTGAVAVDMESAAVALAASARQLPFIAVRVIVDGAHDLLPQAVTAAADRAGGLRLGQLIGALARTPQDLAPVIRLARRYRCASRSLAAVARAGPLAHHAFPIGSDAALS